MELVSIDFLVELPVTTLNNRHMCINDHFTKFIQIYPVSDRTAKTATKCVFLFLKFGISLKLYSDRDSAFEQRRYIRRTTIFIFSFCIGLVTQLNGSALGILKHRYITKRIC